MSGARSWLELLYGRAPGVVAVVAGPGAGVRFYATHDLGAAAGHVASVARRANVYVGACPLVAPPAQGRGGARDAAALVGVWADLDVAGDHHHRPAGALPLPPDRAAALRLVEDLGLAPTAVVDTGGGLQVWWLLDRPWVFAGEDDRAAAAQLSAAFGATLVEHGRRRGLHVDQVGDLARILRPPGTVNRKRAPVPVTLSALDADRRYSVAAVRAALVAPEPPAARPPRRPQPPGRGATGAVESPAEAFARLVSWDDILGPAGFALLYEHGEAAYWHHPASTTGPRSVSATTDAHGVPVVVVHSTSAAGATGLPAGPGHRLTKFRAWAGLHHGGDEAAAARALRAMARGAA